jgi:hypothetical protein
MLGALTRLAPVSPIVPISPIVPPTKKLEVISPRPDFSNRRPAVQPPAAPPRVVLPQSPEDVVLAKAFVEKLLADANNDLKPDEVQAVLLLTKGQILALVEEKERMKSPKAPIVRAAFEHALAVVASMASGAGDADAEKKFPIVPVAIGVAVLAFLLMRR